MADDGAHIVAITLVPALRTDLEPLVADEVRQWLEWAGGILLSMGLSSPVPREPHSAWPTFAQDATLAYGYSGERLRPARPGKYDIDLMDEILALPGLAPDITARRLLHARALVTPIGQRDRYPGAKLAFMCHTSRFRVQRIHAQGLEAVVKRLSLGKAQSIRHSISAST